MADRAPFLIRLEDGTTCRCAADERLLEALRRQRPGGERQGPERQGAQKQGTVTVGCRRGGCGVCRVRIVDGDYAVGPMSRAYVTREDEAEGLVLACCVYPRSDLTVETIRVARPVSSIGRSEERTAAVTSR